MKKVTHALIMAAGRGTRMQHLTDSIPKPMIEYGGYTLIERGIRKIKPYVKHIHITVGYKGAMLAQHVVGLGVDSVINTEGHGNAWWIFNTLMKNLNEPVVVLTADNVTELNFNMLADEYERLNQPPCMVVPVVPVNGLEGDYIHQSKNRVLELNRTKPSNIYCSGIQVLNPCLINQLVEPNDNFYSVWNQLILQNQLMCSDIYPLQWFTVDTPDQLDKLKQQRENDPLSPIKEV